MNIDTKEIINLINKKNLIPRLLIMAFGAFLLALSYNLFLVPNSLVTGGTSGLAIIFNKVFGISTTLFIYASTVVLLLLSLVLLGKEETLKTLVGSILYPIFVTVSLPLSKLILNNIEFENFFLVVLLAGIFYGVANGLIFKTGFTTGGSDILMQIINKYFKVPNGKAIMIVNMVIIFLGGLVFGLTKVLYAVLILIIQSALVDRIVLGISDNKMFFIYTKKIDELKALITEDLKTGITLLATEGGFSKEKNKMIMCVVSTRDYYRFKEAILTIDPAAFIIINDCYEVSGGTKKSSSPFMQIN